MKKYIYLVCLIILFTTPLFSSSDNIKLNILYTNDIHGGIDPVPATFINPDFPPPLGGGASLATYINGVREKAKEKDEGVLLLDQGDFFQGHPVGTMTDGTAIIKWMNAVDYDAMVLGNHDFDAGYDQLKKTLSLAEFPILTANVVLEETGEVIPEAVPYIFKNINGIKIALIGLTTEDTPLMSFPKHVKGLKFLPVAPTLRKYRDIVKKEGADLIVVMGHLGLPYDIESAYQRDIVEGHINDPDRRWPDNAMHLAHKVEDIDMIFGGHIHVGYDKPWEEPETHTLVFQNYAYGSNIGHVIIDVDNETKTITGYNLPDKQYGALVSMFSEEFIPDPTIMEMVDSLQKKAEQGMDSVIGRAGMHLTTYGDAQSLIGNTVMDAFLEHTDADFAFLNLGGVRADIQKGPVTYRDVFEVLPFESRLVTMEISGKTLKKILEVRVSGGRHGLRIAGGKVVNNRNYPDFDRITKIMIGGEKWHPDSTYTVTTTDFLMQGNAGLTLLTDIPENQISYKMTIARDALADYFRNHEVVTAKIDDRWKRDDTSEHSPIIEKYNKQKKQK